MSKILMTVSNRKLAQTIICSVKQVPLPVYSDIRISQLIPIPELS
jgi:hypothetical protein